MRNYRLGIFCLLATVPLFGLVVQEPPTLATVTFMEGGIQIRDAYGRVLDPLLFEDTVFLGSEITDPKELCLVAPNGTGSVACALVEGYLVCAEGQVWTPPCNRARGAGLKKPKV